MMMEVEDDDDWSKSDKTDEDIESSSAVGEQALVRVLISFVFFFSFLCCRLCPHLLQLLCVCFDPS
jgi:hypothetical protein